MNVVSDERSIKKKREPFSSDEEQSVEELK